MVHGKALVLATDNYCLLPSMWNEPTNISFATAYCDSPHHWPDKHVIKCTPATLMIFATNMQGLYLVADDIDAADAWVDALVLCQHLVGSCSSEALEEALVPTPARRGKHALAMAG